MTDDRDEEFEDEEYEDEDETEDEDHEKGRRGAGTFMTGLLVGTAIGAAIGLLFAPGPGDWTRRRLGRRLGRLRDRAEGEIRDLRQEARRRMSRVRT